MVPASLRRSDTNAERAVADFLDSNLYSKHVADFVRFDDYANQLKGKDASFSALGLNNILVDEKSQAHYVNRDLPTFAFEIDSIQSGDRLIEGWLFDESKDTEYYLLIWITASKDKFFSEGDIFALDCILINRKEIIRFLESQSLTKEKVYGISRGIRDEGIPGHRNDFNSCYFYFTGHLNERPMNIVIRREKLRELATKIFTVYPGQRIVETK